MSFRFVHTADLHLDSPLRALALRNPEMAGEVGTATRTALSRIIDLCIDERVDFLVIAGDLWDGAHSSTKTPRFLKQELLRLHGAGIPCFIIRGNHDAMSRQLGELDPPDSVTIFGGRAESVEIAPNGHRVILHGLSFRDQHAPESLLPRYPAPVAGAFNLGIMHTSLNGSATHDTYAPCSLADLEAHGYQYWALGHIHKRSAHLGNAAVVMPGTPQGRDIGEIGATSVTLCHVADDDSLTLEERFVAPLRFDRLELSCDGIEDWPDLVRRVTDALQSVPRETDHLVLRLTLTGDTPLAWRIARDLDRLTEEALALSIPGLWLDKIELRLGETRPPATHLPEDLVTLMMRELQDDPAMTAQIEALTEGVIQYLPADLRDLLGADPAAIAESCHTLLAEGSSEILSRLTSERTS